MNDWQMVVVEELKAINRKMERIEDSLNRDLKSLEVKVHDLEKTLHKELTPIKTHIARVKLIGMIASLGLSALIGKFLNYF